MWHRCAAPIEHKFANGLCDDSLLYQVTTGTSKGTYFCFGDANLSSPESLKKTGLSMKQFCKKIASINCKEKLVVSLESLSRS